MHIDPTGLMGIPPSTRATKMNIESIEDVDYLYKLEPIKFDYRKKVKEDGEIKYLDEPEIYHEQKEYGFLAEQMEEHNRNLCTYDNEGKLIGVRYDKMVAPLCKAVQDMKKYLDSLKAELEQLK
jgi:hypothetical protein